MNQAKLSIEADLPQYVGVDPKLLKSDSVIGIERWSDIFEELAPIGEAHSRELNGPIIKNAVLQQDWSRFFQAEKSGQLVCFTLRHRLDLIGYYLYVVAPFPHAVNTLAATEWGIYIHPDHRGGTKFVRLMDFAEETLKGFGVGIITVSHRGPSGGPDLDKFVKRKGYTPTTTFYVKEI